VFCLATETAVRAFQAAHGLHPDGVCDDATWTALVEASWALGDRLLAYRTPMLRGDDVAELQSLLGRLGFDAGRVDGIFGPRAAVAVAEFQRNCGLHPDGICGFETLQALRRVVHRTGDTAVAAVREQEQLRRASPHLADKRVVVGELGGLGPLCRAVTKSLRRAGAQVISLDEPSATVQAATTNRFGADLYLGLRLTDGPSSVAYYAVSGFESVGGRRLAELLHEQLATLLPSLEAHPRGMRLPVLRETRMPAVLCSLGPPPVVSERSPRLAAAVACAVGAWVATPTD
jgi:N-acetylmuramoyl-L-alanine amidase